MHIEYVGGFVLGTVVGIAGGLALGVSRVAKMFTGPTINALYATPIVALLPLIIIWFGIGLEEKFFFVFLAAVFPVLMNTVTGIEGVDKQTFDNGQVIWAEYSASLAQHYAPERDADHPHWSKDRGRESNRLCYCGGALRSEPRTGLSHNLLLIIIFGGKNARYSACSICNRNSFF